MIQLSDHLSVLFQLHDCTFKKKFYKPVSIRKSNLKFCRDTSIKDTYKTPKKQISVAVSSRNRSSPSELFLGKGVLKICSKFTGKHLWRGACRNNNINSIQLSQLKKLLVMPKLVGGFVICNIGF